MKITREILIKIKSTLDYIIDNIEWFSDYAKDLSLKEEDFDKILKSGKYTLPKFEFPGEDEAISIPLRDFLRIADEIPTIELTENNSVVKTKLHRYYIVNGIHNFPDNIIIPAISDKNKYSISLVNNPILVGFAATKYKLFDEDFVGVLELHTAIEIIYKDESNILTDTDERNLINSYIFELADTFNVALTSSEIIDFSVYTDEDEVNETQTTYFLRELEKYNEGMKLFISAIQIEEEELKFLNFYKILEHYAPIAVNIEAKELMRKKLDVARNNFDNGDYIQSIYDLAKSVRDRYNDEDLIKSTINSCFDFIGLFNLLPESLKRKIKKQISEQDITYSLDKQKITTAINMIGKIIYSTRNRVVHAKSNYESSGNECESSEMEQLNIFMKEACSQAIRWYNRQPTHLQLSIVK